MLIGIDPLLSGDLLRILDHMGHNDTLLVTDAHYPSYAMGVPVIASFIVASSRRTHWYDLLRWFLTNCASSRTSISHSMPW